MLKRMVKAAALMALVVGFTASNALAFSCPKLIAAGRTLAAKAKGMEKEEALKLLNEAQQAHEQAVKDKTPAGHQASMQKGADAIDKLVKAMPQN
ncbi:MAG: hypothetical protein AABZ64_05995 [Nitrospinota bacterium]